MKSIKKVLITWILVSMVGFVFTGCMNKDVVVATINGQNVSEPLYRIFLWVSQRGIESVQADFWDMDSFEGKTPEEYAKDKALKSLSYCVIVAQKSKELNVNLTDEEKAKVKEAAKEAIKEEEALAKLYGIKQKDYETYYTYGIQTEKVKAILSESYEPNNEELEAAIDAMKENNEIDNKATISHILFNTKDELGNDLPADKKQAVYEKAQQVLEEALSGENMNELAIKYSDDTSVGANSGEYTFTEGSMEERIEEVAFDENYLGKVYPKLIETSMGYEIIKVNNIDLVSEDSLKEKAAIAVKTKFAEDELSQMCELADIKKNEVYETIHIMKVNENSN